MAKKSDLDKVAAKANLERAWLYLRTSTERTYRDYTRPLYRAFAFAADDRLASLRERIASGTYRPSPPTKVYFPKPGGLQRTYSILSVEDHIVYQAFANIVGDRLLPIVRPRYNKSVFGHLISLPHSDFFYRDWRKAYPSFTGAMRGAFADGYVYTASFDLTACYDSIDHSVLTHFLRALKLEPEFCSRLCDLLKRWTDSGSGKVPILHSHGIPQGPVPSGLLAEVVLRHFDDAKRTPKLRYFRYVDDIRLFAKDERTLLFELMQLDMRSKQIGLFPQASKISIHRVTNIEAEFKGISLAPPTQAALTSSNQTTARRRVISLTRRFKVSNVSQFKYELGGIAPTSALTVRLLEILRREPSLFLPVSRYVSRSRSLSPLASVRLLEVIKEHDRFAGLAAALLRACRDNLSPSVRTQLFAYCRSRITGKRGTWSAEVRAAAAAILLTHNQLPFDEAKRILSWPRSAWMRAWTLHFLEEGRIGRPSYESAVHSFLRDPEVDVALAAAELVITRQLALPKPLGPVNSAAQHALKAAGRIGRIRKTDCPISHYCMDVMGASISALAWRRILTPSTYKSTIPTAAAWAAYWQTDATAWVLMTDTLNDLLLHALSKHDPSIGKYAVGSIGSFTQNKTLPTAYPLFWKGVLDVHDRRLQAYLAHPVVRSTGTPTRRITFREAKTLRDAVKKGWLELQRKW